MSSNQDDRSNAAHAKSGTQRPSLLLDKSIFTIVATLLLFVCIVLIGHLLLQWDNYHQAIQAALQEKPIAHPVILGYSRAMDFALSETSIVFLGFILVFIGAIYLLRLNEAAYAIGMESGDLKISFQSTAPGLVLATLGVLTVVFAVYQKTFTKLETNSHPIDRTEVNIEEVINEISFKEGSKELTDESSRYLPLICSYITTNSISNVSLDVKYKNMGSDAISQALLEARRGYLAELLKSTCNTSLTASFTGWGESPLHPDNPARPDIVIEFNK